MATAVSRAPSRRSCPKRLPLIPPGELNAEQVQLYEDMRDGIESGFGGFTTRRDDGTLVGPWNPWRHEPKIGAGVWGLTKALSAQYHAARFLPAAILVTGAHFHAGYEIYAHVAVAQKDGLSNETIATIVAGERPADLPHNQAIAYDVAATLVRGASCPG